MALTLRLDDDDETILEIIGKLENTTKTVLVREAVRLLIKKRLEDPEFKKKLEAHFDNVRIVIEALEL